MNVDVLIVGGSFAGLSAAMQLVRARRSVVVIDADHPRNRFAKASHGVFCLDGFSPAQIRATALAQLERYPDFHLIHGSATQVAEAEAGFEVVFEDGGSVLASRLILASGLEDRLPDIPGLQAHWGKAVVHCPYCHGYELRDRELGVLATSEMALHLAAMIPDWGATTLFTQGQHTPDAETRAHLYSRGVRIENTPVVEIIGDGEHLSHVRLSDGRTIETGGLYVGPKVEVTCPLAASLGLDTEETPLGNCLRVDEFKATSRPGVFAAGDISNPMQNATLAISSGMIAGVGAHRSLIFS